MTTDIRYCEAKKITVLGGISNFLLGVAKVIGGLMYHSHALVADGIHSFADLATDAMVLVASKYGSMHADDNHPYGHQRFETAATFLISLLLIIAGMGIAWDSISELYHAESTHPDWFAIPIICMSIGFNEALFHYTLYVGTQIKSKLIIANAWHHRSDAASSLVVLVGLLGSLLGQTYLDTIAAFVVALLIVKMGWNYGWNSIKELVDTAVEPELLEKIEDIIKSIEGVRKIHQLRSRFMGEDVLIDVHILVPPKISVSEGHYIAQQVDQALVSQIAHVTDVIVHVDPEDDECESPALHSISRATLDDKLLKQLQLDFPDILFWNLHYLDGKVHIDITCAKQFALWDELHQAIIKAFELNSPIQSIQLFSLQKKIHAPL